MTHEQAIAEVERRRISAPGFTWVATQREGEWTVAGIGVTPSKPTGTATKPPPAAPAADPYSPIQRAAWFSAGG